MGKPAVVEKKKEVLVLTVGKRRVLRKGRTRLRISSRARAFRKNVLRENRDRRRKESSMQTLPGREGSDSKNTVQKKKGRLRGEEGVSTREKRRDAKGKSKARYIREKKRIRRGGGEGR